MFFINQDAGGQRAFTRTDIMDRERGEVAAETFHWNVTTGDIQPPLELVMPYCARNVGKLLIGRKWVQPDLLRRHMSLLKMI